VITARIYIYKRQATIDLTHDWPTPSRGRLKAETPLSDDERSGLSGPAIPRSSSTHGRGDNNVPTAEEGISLWDKMFLTEFQKKHSARILSGNRFKITACVRAKPVRSRRVGEALGVTGSGLSGPTTQAPAQTVACAVGRDDGILNIGTQSRERQDSRHPDHWGGYPRGKISREKISASHSVSAYPIPSGDPIEMIACEQRPAKLRSLAGGVLARSCGSWAQYQ